MAEIIGGAIALNLLFDLPLIVGGCIVGAVSMLLLVFQIPEQQRHFEFIIVGLLLIITVGFLSGLIFAPPSPSGVLGGMVPRFTDTNSVLIGASMLGATVMPHAIYLHSSLVNHRFPKCNRDVPLLLRATKHDVVWALVLAGSINIALLLLAASALGGVEGTDSIEGAHAAITSALGSGIGVIFAIGLLASGLASTSVGAYAGSEFMYGLLHIRVPLVLRRAITLIPALILVWLYPDPSWALVLSQVALSFGIPFAIIPLSILTRKESVMGTYRDGVWVRWTMNVVSAMIVVLNFALIYLTFTTDIVV